MVDYIYIYIELNSKQYAVLWCQGGTKRLIESSMTQHTDAVWSLGHNEFGFTITIIILLFTNQVSVQEGSMVHVELMALRTFYAH